MDQWEDVMPGLSNAWSLDTFWEEIFEKDVVLW